MIVNVAKAVSQVHLPLTLNRSPFFSARTVNCPRRFVDTGIGSRICYYCANGW